MPNDTRQAARRMRWVRPVHLPNLSAAVEDKAILGNFPDRGNDTSNTSMGRRETPPTMHGLTRKARAGNLNISAKHTRMAIPARLTRVGESRNGSLALSTGFT